MNTSKLLNNSTSAESFLESLNLFSNSYRSEDNQELFQHFQRLKNYSKQNPILEDLCLTNKEFQLFEEECEAIEAQTRYLFYDNWVTVMKNDELFVQTFKGPDQFLARLKFNIKADPMQVFSVFYETDFMGDWIKTIKTSATIEETSIFRKKIQNIYNLPWPLVNRHSILNVRYFPLHEMKTILIISYTPKENFKNPNSNDKLIEMVLPSASTWIECLGNECNICIIFQANQFIVLFK
jgi:hypothetical protein